MRKILVTLLSTVAMMGIASLAFAADGAPVKLDSASLGLALFRPPSAAAPSAWPSPPPVAVSVRASV